MERLINSPSISNEIVERTTVESLLGRQYGCMGLVQDVKVKQIGLFTTVDRKNVVSRVPVTIDMNIFSIPNGFVISNAILIAIKPVSNNVTYVFNCNFYDVDGNEIAASKTPNTIIGTVTTMDKSQESLARYKFLKVGDRVNLTCIMPIIRDGTKNQVFNCDIIDHLEPKYFMHDAQIDVAAILKLTVKDKIKYPLFQLHTSESSKPTTNLVEGKIYAMTIYGFHESAEETSIDFIKQKITTETMASDSDFNVSIGISSLNNYLYYTMYNWKCAFEGLNIKENGGEDREGGH
jgi:hypothetical protein